MTRRAVPRIDVVAINAVLISARQAIDIMCDRWSLIVILALLQGETRFNGLMSHTGMASRLLTARLRTLEATGIVFRMPYSMHPVRHEYALTNMGRDLFDVVLQMARWEQNWSGPTDARSPLLHRPCNTPLSLEVCCRMCGLPTDARQIDLKVSRAQLEKAPTKQVRHRRSSIDDTMADAPVQMLGPALDIFGDKWGIEILICAFFRIHRFGDFREAIGISGNILSDRLERLVAANVLRRGDESRQSGYWLTPKGIDVYAIMVAVHEWADIWVRARYRSPVRMIHRACGATFLPSLSCARCTKSVLRGEVDLAPDASERQAFMYVSSVRLKCRIRLS